MLSTWNAENINHAGPAQRGRGKSFKALGDAGEGLIVNGSSLWHIYYHWDRSGICESRGYTAVLPCRAGEVYLATAPALPNTPQVFLALQQHSSIKYIPPIAYLYSCLFNISNSPGPSSRSQRSR